MNINFLDDDPAQCARYHVDRHVSKQILETVQLLQAAHMMCDGDKLAYRNVGGFIKAPWGQSQNAYARWVRATDRNYQWTHALLTALCAEYELRFAKVNALERLIEVYAKAPMLISLGQLKPFTQDMLPQRCWRVDPLEGHRDFYMTIDVELAVWSPPAVTPHWFLDRKMNRDTMRRVLRGGEFHA